MRTLLHRIRNIAGSILRCIATLLSKTMRCLPVVARAATSYKTCILLLLAAVAVELCVLGAGVIRKLENSYHLAEEAARTELALLEAQELADTMPNKFSYYAIIFCVCNTLNGSGNVADAISV